MSKQLKLFGGLAVLLVGNPGQLPPVQGLCLWDDTTKMNSTEDVTGLVLYSKFQSVIKLTINHQVDGLDEEAQQFCELQGQIRDAEVTEQDWNVLKTRSRDSLGYDEWI